MKPKCTFQQTSYTLKTALMRFSLGVVLTVAASLPVAADTDSALRNTTEDFADCRASIESAINSYDGSQRSIEICPELIEGVRFTLVDFVLSGPRTIRQGGAGDFLAVRQRGYRRDAQNHMSILLTPLTGFRDFWSVSFIDQSNPDQVFTRTARDEYFLFTHDERDHDNRLPYGYPYSDDTVRVINCFPETDLGCAVHHEIDVCAGWEYPQVPRPDFLDRWAAKPVLAIVSLTPDDRDYFFNVFRDVNLRAQDIVREVKEMSCS